MKSKILFAFVGVILSITITGVASEGANPFNPISYSGTNLAPPPGSVEGVHPLQQSPVNSYILMGVITSSKGKIGLIKAKNGGEYFVRVEELLGNENGKITQINRNGIEISEKDKIVSLLVRNRSVRNEKTK